MKSPLIKNTLKTVSGRRGVLVAAAAATAAASAWERSHRGVRRADMTDAGSRVERLSDLRYEKAMVETIEAGLVEEWGEFAFVGCEDMDEMVSLAGDSIFVVLEDGEAGPVALGIVQTMLAHVHGDPALLLETYPDFASLTSPESWKRSRAHGGDTAILLQITTLNTSKRSGGTGALLRNAALNMLEARVSYALTTTPVDGATLAEVDVEQPKTYTAAMRFHARGGASPAFTLPGYKQPKGAATKHGEDVIVMRYARDESGIWPAPRPVMRMRRMGPLQRRANLALRRLRRMRRPSRVRLQRPRFALKPPKPKRLLSGIKGRLHLPRRGVDDRPAA